MLSGSQHAGLESGSGSEPKWTLRPIHGPNPQVYRKVPITINPVHRSRASQHPWLPERSTKLAVGASCGVLPPHSHYKQGQYSRFLRPVVAYGDGYSSPPIPGVYVCIFIWRHIPSEIISQPEPGVVFKHSLLHSKLEYPDLPQPPECIPVTAVDRHQGNMTKSYKKGVHSGNIQGTLREH